MLTNPRDAFRRSVNVTKHDTIRYARYGFLLLCYSNFVPKTHRFLDIRFQNAVTLKKELGVRRGHWKCHRSIERYRFLLT